MATPYVDLVVDDRELLILEAALRRFGDRPSDIPDGCDLSDIGQLHRTVKRKADELAAKLATGKA